MSLSAPRTHLTGCRLVALDGRTLPLRNVSLTATAAAGSATVTLVQTFANPYPDPLAATYQLPLPADGAVIGFHFVVGGRRFVGRVEGRAQARAAFERAVSEGRTAALLEQDRSSLFTQELGNLPPGGIVEVHVEVEQPLAWEQGGWSWRFPTVVAPRFIDPQHVADPDRIHVDVADRDPVVPVRVAMHIADTCTGAATSPSHDVEVDGDVHLLRGTLDRDLVLRWGVSTLEPGMTVEVARPTGITGAFGLLTLVPPVSAAPMRPVSRDLILLLDTSGSMGGRPLSQLQAFGRSLVSGLASGDRLEMIEFSRQPNRWRSAPVAIDEASRAEALVWVDGLRASGGTRMHDAIREALEPLREEALRQVVLVTDGLIGGESALVAHILDTLPSGCRVHTVGIGSAPNRSLTAAAARAGAGHESIVGVDDPVEPAVAALLARTQAPLLVDVTVAGTAVVSAAPARIPDLMAGSPARIALALRPEGGTLVVQGRGVAGSWTETHVVAPIAEGRGHRGVATRFARECVADLELQRDAGRDAGSIDAEIERLGIVHQIATRRTSWIAETTEATVDPGAPARHEQIPQALPHGMSAEGVGLRAAGAPGGFPVGSPMTTLPLGGPPRLQASRSRGRRRPEPKSKRKAPPPAPRAQAPRDRSPVEKDSASRADSPAEPPPPPAGPSSTFEGFADISGEDDLEAVLGEAHAPEPVGPPMPPPPTHTPRLIARVRTNQDGVLVLEVTATGSLDWDATGTLVALLDDGSTLRISAEAGTTHPTQLQPGQIARIRLAWSGPLPRTLALRHLVLEIG